MAIKERFINGDVLLIGNDQEIEVIGTLPTVVNGWVIGYITYMHGYVYATAIGENKIYRISLDGEITHFAGSGASGSADGELLEATFRNPNGIEADPATNTLYITEARQQGQSGTLRVIQLPM